MKKRGVYVFIAPDGSAKTYEMSLEKMANAANKDGRLNYQKSFGASIED
jgi:hypothetical protein